MVRSRLTSPLSAGFSLVVALLIGCGDDGDGSGPPTDVSDAGPDDGGGREDAGPPVYDFERFERTLTCPGDEGCPPEGDGALWAGASALAITPDFDPDEAEYLTVDVADNGVFNPGDGDEFQDTNGNGELDGIWVAGFGNGRPASGVNDDQWARAIALRQNGTTVALVSLDLVGLFHDDVVLIREKLAEAGVDVDWVMVASTHTHQARDTMGLWGRNVAESGIDPAYQEMVRTQAAQAVEEAVDGLTPVHVQYASLRLRDQEGGIRRWVSDIRDPYVLDDEMRLVRFLSAEGGDTVATLINFGAHPEYATGDNTLLSSDFPHWLREGVEGGATGPGGDTRDGVGGVAVFLNGAVGSQIGPGDLAPETWEGTEPAPRIETARTVGEQLAWFALGALGPDGGSVTEETADLGVRVGQAFVDVQNRKFHAAFLFGVLDREAFHYDDSKPITPDVNEPDLRTEVAVLDLGRAQFLSVPGELDPVLFLGGYDGSFTPADRMVVDPARDNPIDLDAAPEGPYLRDLMREDATMRGVFGLANDQLGYFIPSFDFQVDPDRPYFAEPPGDHYEETNSLGPDVWPTLEAGLIELLGAE